MSSLLELPALATAAPDVAAAEAALSAALPDESPPADAAAPNAPPPAASPPSTADSLPRGPARPATDRWSDRRMSKASRAELRARVKELQERPAPPIAAPDGAASIEPPAAALDPAELVAPLGLTFSTVAALAATVYGPHWKLTDEETRALGMAWAPIAVRYAANAGAALPWALALLTTAGVLAPKLQAHADAARLSSAEAVPADAPPPLRGPDA